MRKIFNFIKQNLLFVETLVLLAFIPLYPKIPLINVNNTWVYIRLEDFLVAGVLLCWLALLYRKKITLRTPLTIPILIYWIIGAVATIHGVLLIFPTLANVFPNVAFLTFVRHVEYLSLFFIAYEGMKDKKFLYFVVATLVLTLLAIIFYGFGQKYFGFPAFLTSNEEFAKGIPIQLSQLSRVPSTFAGHYDLAAYLVLIIPIIISLFFAFKNWFVKIFLFIVTLLSFWLLFTTVSRVSLVVAIFAVFVVLYFQKRKLFFASIPLLLFAGLILLSFKPTTLDRFKNTVDTVDVMVDATTGSSVGHVEFVPKAFFKDKIVLQQRVKDGQELVNALAGNSNGSPSAILSYEYIPDVVPMVKAVNLSTGENLPSGTGYINLALSPVIQRAGNFFYEFPPNVSSSPSAQFLVLHGNFIIKRAAAYDLSFTTRFQGEWPRAIEAFQRNIFLGSGYSAVTLAVDNNYLRFLGETGILGTVALLSIFISFAIYLKKSWKNINSSLEKNFILGFGAGLIGLGLNATLIDVFEASKIAYTIWLLMGVTLGIIVLNIKEKVNLLEEFKKIALTPFAVFSYLAGLTIVVYAAIINNFFIGDDFTWLRWAAQSPSNPLSYFVTNDGFFYRPGTKIYFDLIYHFFWLNPMVYHIISVFLHFIVSFLLFLLAKKVFKNTLVAACSSLLFLVMSGYSETVFWVSASGHLFNAIFGILGLLLFIKWEEDRKKYFWVLSFISFGIALFFHELGIVFPFLIIAYKILSVGVKSAFNEFRKKEFLAFFTFDIFYLLLRFVSHSHWFSGDYSYNLIKLPFNFFGNLIGYVAVILVGPTSITFYEKLRLILKDNLVLSSLLIFACIAFFYLIYKTFKNAFDEKEKRILAFGFSFFLISLLPFLGLGNITSRYSYLATIGLIFVLIIIIKKVYEFLLLSGREIALGVLAVIILIFSLYHIISFQKSFADWAGASTRVNNFFISFDSFYNNYWTTPNTEFHFVNVPIKYGQAWVFPVGLSDAVWFAVRNNNARVFLDKDVNSALNEVGSSIINKIFVFNDDGALTEITQRNK